MPVVRGRPCPLWIAALLLSIGIGGVVSRAQEPVSAARNRDFKALAALVARRADVNARQPDGATALHWAVHWGNFDAVDLLLRAGAKVDAANDYGVTPLFLASNIGSTRVIERLLDAGANPRTALPTGETALMAAARTGTLASVTALLARGADVHGRESFRGQNALMWAVAEKHLDVVRALLDHGADVTARSAAGYTALLFAVRENDLEAVRLLLSRNADVNERGADGTTPLIIATVRGFLPLAEFLLANGANPNADAPGFTALHWASGVWETHMTRAYHESSIRGMFGLTPARRVDFVKTLLAYGANPNARLSNDPPMPARNGFGRQALIGSTPLVLAATAGDVAVMRVLLAGGADPMVRTDDGSSALLLAAGFLSSDATSVVPESARLAATSLCLQLGIDVNAANSEGDSPLHAAAFAGFTSVAQLLVGRGGNLAGMNKNGATPLGVAEGERCCYSNIQMVYRQDAAAEFLRKMAPPAAGARVSPGAK